jgi:hypothetical protein
MQVEQTLLSSSCDPSTNQSIFIGVERSIDVVVASEASPGVCKNHILRGISK